MSRDLVSRAEVRKKVVGLFDILQYFGCVKSRAFQTIVFLIEECMDGILMGFGEFGDQFCVQLSAERSCRGP